MKNMNKLFLGSALAACLALAGCSGTTEAPKETTPPTTNGGGSGDNAAVDPGASAGEMTLVKLKLPNMT